jgi:uncharacterized cupin superfamily protein
MAHIKHTSRPRVLPETAPMAFDNETEVPSRQMEGLPDASSWRSPDDSNDCESRFGGSGDAACKSDNSSRAKVDATAATAGITFDFGLSTVGKSRITSMETCTCYFLKGYCRVLGTEIV